jgi:lipopolysaccharide/colanic/teichoic acid biosynthesis glycosyltransferase
MSQLIESDTSVLQLSDPALDSVVQKMTQPRSSIDDSLVPLWKRIFDITLVILVLPLLVPLALLIAIAIKLVSRGPVLFKQERIGLLGERFLCLKFRTMLVNADTTVHQGHLTHLMSANCPMTKLDSTGDPRLIPAGRILRALGIDELPQVINVLRGEMSLVGPRPCVPYEYEKYIPRHRQRCGTLPGLTGWWQVNGKNRTTFEQMMNLDLFYVRNKSLLLDIRIIAGTIPAIMGQVWDMKRRKKLRKVLSLSGFAATRPLDPQY